MQTSNKITSSNNMVAAPRFTIRLLCVYLLIGIIFTAALYDQASAQSKKFIKGFILGALVAKNYPPTVVVHDAPKLKF